MTFIDDLRTRWEVDILHHNECLMSVFIDDLRTRWEVDIHTTPQ